MAFSPALWNPCPKPLQFFGKLSPSSLVKKLRTKCTINLSKATWASQWRSRAHCLASLSLSIPEVLGLARPSPHLLGLQGPMAVTTVACFYRRDSCQPCA